MDNTLNRYNVWWEKTYKPNYIERTTVIENIFSLLEKWQIIFLTGLRGTGKTTIMKLLIRELVNNQKYDPKRILYIKMDDYLLSKYNIPEIVDHYRKIHQIKFNDTVYLCIDKIAAKENFDLQLQKLIENLHIKIIVSIADLSLSKSKALALSYCSIAYEIPPLDFTDYLNFKKISITVNNQHLLTSYFEDFLRTGGIPEFVINGDEGYIRELVDDIIYKEIAAPHGIKNVQILKDYFMLLMDRAGKIFSINQIASLLEISPDSSKRYLEMFMDTYLVYAVNRWGKSTEKEHLTARKIYACDTGILNVFTEFRDIGNLFENYVYLKIKDRNPSYIYNNGIELDFLTDKNELLDVRYDGKELQPKQSKLFNDFEAKHKYIFRGIEDLEDFLAK